MRSGYEIWRGPSVMDGEPIMLLVSPVIKANNRKTGAMAQLYVFRRDVPPGEAMDQGLDESVCGDCPARHFLGGHCYVQPVSSGLNSIYQTWADGRYPQLPISIEDFFAGLRVRLTAYGDLAAVPLDIIERIVTASSDHTAYTEQWRWLDRRVAKWAMASVHSAEEAEEARALGWRTFRDLGPDEEEPGRREVECHNSTTGLQCAACLVCRGGTGPGIYVRVHGNRADRKTVSLGSGDPQ